MLIRSAVDATGGDLTDREALRAALRAADFDSVRGEFRFNHNHFPVQGFHLREVVRGDDGGWGHPDRRDHLRRARRPLCRRVPPWSGDRGAADRQEAMNGLLAFEQVLNGIQTGILLFLVSAGLTLTFGVLRFVNLAHAALFMLGRLLRRQLHGMDGVPLGGRGRGRSSRPLPSP